MVTSFMGSKEKIMTWLLNQSHAIYLGLNMRGDVWCQSKGIFNFSMDVEWGVLDFEVFFL